MASITLYTCQNNLSHITCKGKANSSLEPPYQTVPEKSARLTPVGRATAVPVWTVCPNLARQETTFPHSNIR